MKNDIKRPPLTGELKQVPSLSPTTLAISKFRKLFWVTYRFHTCSSWLFCCQFSFKMVYCSFEEKYFSDLRGKPLFDESGPLSELKITANDSNIFIIYWNRRWKVELGKKESAAESFSSAITKLPGNIVRRSWKLTLIGEKTYLVLTTATTLTLAKRD